MSFLSGFANCATMAAVLLVASSCGSTQPVTGDEPASGATSGATAASSAPRSPSATPSTDPLDFPDDFVATMKRHGLILEPLESAPGSVSADRAVDVAVSTWALFGREDPLTVQLFRATLPELGPLSDPSDPDSPVVPTYVDVPMWVIYAPVQLPRFEPSPELGTVRGSAVAVVTAKGEAVSAWTF